MNYTNPSNIQIGEKIKLLRKAKEMTQADLAHAAGCSDVYISRLERGEVECDAGNLFAIKKALDIPKAPLTQDEMAVYTSMIWVWHEQINTRRISDAIAMKDELANILHMPFEWDLQVIFLMQETRLLLMQSEDPGQRLEKAEAILKEHGNNASTEALYLYHMTKTTVLVGAGEYKNALKHGQKAEAYNNASSILTPSALVFTRIAQSYLHLGRPYNALIYSERALMADKNDATDSLGPFIRMMQAAIYTILGELDRAKRIYEEQYMRSKSINDKTSIGFAAHDLGCIELKMGNAAEALKLINQAEAYINEGGIDGHNALLSAVIRNNKVKCLMQLKRYDECKKIIEDGLVIAKEENNETNIIYLETVKCLMTIKDPKSQDYLENITIPYYRNSNSTLIYDVLEICHTLENFYNKNRSKTKALNMAKVSRDILHEMFYGCPVEVDAMTI